MKTLLSKIKSVYVTPNSVRKLLDDRVQNVNLHSQDLEEYKKFLWIVAMMLAGNSKNGHNHLYFDILNNYDVNTQQEIIETGWGWAQRLGAKSLDKNTWATYYNENPQLIIGGKYDGITNWSIFSSKVKENPRNIIKQAHLNAIAIFKALDKKKVDVKDRETKMILITSIMILHNDASFDFFKDLITRNYFQDYEKQDYYKNIFYSNNIYLDFYIKFAQYKIDLFDELNLKKNDISHIIKLIDDMSLVGKELLKNSHDYYDASKLLCQFEEVGEKLSNWIKKEFSLLDLQDNSILELRKVLLRVKKVINSEMDVVTESSFLIEFPLTKINLIRNKMNLESIDIEKFSYLLKTLNGIKDTVFFNKISPVSEYCENGLNIPIAIYFCYPKEISVKNRNIYIQETFNFLEKLILNPNVILKNSNIENIQAVNIKNHVDNKKVKNLSDEIIMNVEIHKNLSSETKKNLKF